MAGFEQLVQSRFEQKVRRTRNETRKIVDHRPAQCLKSGRNYSKGQRYGTHKKCSNLTLNKSYGVGPCLFAPLSLHDFFSYKKMKIRHSRISEEKNDTNFVFFFISVILLKERNICLFLFVQILYMFFYKQSPTYVYFLSEISE